MSASLGGEAGTFDACRVSRHPLVSRHHAVHGRPVYAEEVHMSGDLSHVVVVIEFGSDTPGVEAVEGPFSAVDAEMRAEDMAFQAGAKRGEHVQVARLYAPGETPTAVVAVAVAASPA